MDQLSESELALGLGLDQVAVFEATVQVFLRREMLFFNETIIFSNINVTVVSRLLSRDQQVPARESSVASLIIDANVTALASPADVAVEFPFQTIIHGILLQNIDEFYYMLFSSSEFEALQEPEYSLIRGGGGNSKSMVLGSSIAGSITLLSLFVAFVVIRQRHGSKKGKRGADCDLPPSGTPQIIEVGELPNPLFDDSSLPDDMYPNNVPHKGAFDANVWCDSLPSARNIATKSVAALDEWSICDEDVMHRSHLMPHSLLTDSEDSITATSFDAELAQDLYTINDSMLQSAQEEQTSQTANVFTRLFDSSEAEILGPKPNSPSSGPKLFSNKTLGKSKAAEAPCKVSGNVYQVRAPPGPLGIVIDSSKDGPVICKV